MTPRLHRRLLRPDPHADEGAFFRDAAPWGFILFKRNIEAPGQVRALTHALRETVGRDDAPILIDQEGGRVQRMGPPHWPAYPPGRAYGAHCRNDPLVQREIARLGARLMAHDLREVGINVDCVPVLDVPVAGAHDVIGDRAYGRDPETVAILGRAAAEGLIAGGVLPVIKHIPGHGRAGADSHHDLPVVERRGRSSSASDFAPFRHLADMPLAMTAHVVYTALDPERPATTSPAVMRDVIRGRIALRRPRHERRPLDERALPARSRERAAAAFAAGCDMALHCNGRLDEMEAVASETPALDGRGDAARRGGARPDPARARAPGCCGRTAEVRGRACGARLSGQSSHSARIELGHGRGVTLRGCGACRARRPASRPCIVDVDGFEGPLDLLLELARRQKVDLHRISILALAEQYLVFIEEARQLRLELAADYLVMAAWLAYLKSRLLLPEPPKGEEPSAADLATALALRLRRLEAIREAAQAHRRARPARPRRLRPRRAGAGADPQGGRLGGDPLRPPLGLCPPAPEADATPA